MVYPGRPLSAAEAAAAIGVGRTTVRRLFDTSGGAAGTRDPDTGTRLFSPAWVQAQAARRAARSPHPVPGGLSVAQAAVELSASATAVRRWFDRDQPISGVLIQGGRTGSTERRCDARWVRALKDSLRRPR